MSSIIPSSFPKSNYFNHPSNRVNTLNPLKIHSADIAFLLVLRFFTLKGHRRHCCLSKRNDQKKSAELDQWNVWLVKFGGKALGRGAFKNKRHKFIKMGYIICWYPNQNRNLSYNYVLTPDGLDAVDKYLASCVARKKTDPRNRIVEDPNKQKTDPPLNHDKGKENIKDIKDEMPVNNSRMSRAEINDGLERLGMSEDTVNRLMCRYSETELIYGIMETDKRNPRIKWAYFRNVMKNNFGEADCFFRVKNRRSSYE